MLLLLPFDEMKTNTYGLTGHQW